MSREAAREVARLQVLQEEEGQEAENEEKSIREHLAHIRERQREISGLLDDFDLFSNSNSSPKQLPFLLHPLPLPLTSPVIPVPFRIAPGTVGEVAFAYALETGGNALTGRVTVNSATQRILLSELSQVFQNATTYNSTAVSIFWPAA